MGSTLPHSLQLISKRGPRIHLVRLGNVGNLTAFEVNCFQFSFEMPLEKTFSIKVSKLVSELHITD